MLRHLPQPVHAGGLEPDVGVEAARDGAVDDGLLPPSSSLISFCLARMYRRIRRSA